MLYKFRRTLLPICTRYLFQDEHSSTAKQGLAPPVHDWHSHATNSDHSLNNYDNSYDKRDIETLIRERYWEREGKREREIEREKKIERKRENREIQSDI